MTVYFIIHITIKPMLKKNYKYMYYYLKKCICMKNYNNKNFILNTISLQNYERINNLLYIAFLAFKLFNKRCTNAFTVISCWMLLLYVIHFSILYLS